MRTFLRLFSFLRPYRRAALGSIALAAAAMAITAALPWLTGRAIDRVIAGDRGGLGTVIGAILLAAVLRFVIAAARRIVAGRVSLAVEADMRGALYGHLLELDMGFHDSSQTGQLMSRATVDLQSVRFFLGYGLVFIIQSLLTILLAAVAMVLLDPLLGLLALIPVPFVAAVAYRYSSVSRPAQQAVQQRIAELAADAQENVSGVGVVKAFAREERQLRRFSRTVTRVFDQHLLATRQRALYQPLIGFLPQLGLALVLLVGGLAVIDGRLTPGEFAAFYTYVLMLAAPMRMVGIALGMAQRATASGARLFELLDRRPDPEIAPGLPPLAPGRGRIDFEHVTLRYAGSSGDALSDVSLTVPAGSTTAIIGPTGSGKSSLIGLIARLYDATAGVVRVDGADVTAVDPASLRGAIAVVTDEPVLFSDSLSANIAYGRPGASAEELRRAATRAQALGFIAGLPDGFDTVIGERGLTLSGGQRQRVAIARALAAEPRILLLDDATSALDATTEAELARALRVAMAGRTTVLIAHRRSTLELADHVVLLEGGRVTAAGTHAEMAAASAFYAELTGGPGAAAAPL